jgi:hypothetical protein
LLELLQHHRPNLREKSPAENKLMAELIRVLALPHLPVYLRSTFKFHPIPSTVILPKNLKDVILPHVDFPDHLRKSRQLCLQELPETVDVQIDHNLEDAEPLVVLSQSLMTQMQSLRNVLDEGLLKGQTVLNVIIGILVLCNLA